MDPFVPNPGVHINAAELSKRLFAEHGSEFNRQPVLAVVGEYARFIELKIRLKDFDAKLLSPPPLVDLVWHTHILDTAGYTLFCTIVGGQLVHHNPNGGLDAAAQAERYRRTYEAYKASFNMVPDPKFWPAPTEDAVTPPPPPPPPPKKRKANEDNDTMTVFVKTLTGKTISLHLPRSATVRDAVKEVERVDNISVDLQRLIFGGRQITPFMTDRKARADWLKPLASYGIQHESTIHLVLRMGGC